MYFTELPNFDPEILKIIGSYSENEIILTNKRKIDDIKYLCIKCNKYHIEENYIKYIPRKYDQFNQLMENIDNNEFRFEIETNTNYDVNNNHPLCINCFRNFRPKSKSYGKTFPLIFNQFETDIQKLMKNYNYEIYDINILKKFYKEFHTNKFKNKLIYLKNREIGEIEHKKIYKFFTKIFKKIS